MDNPRHWMTGGRSGLMKEDQTQLITARLEHLQFLMDGGMMPVFRQRSDMFLFALEAYNIARGLSSRYYRLRDDLDIRFFVRFQFDYWLEAIQKWIELLGSPEYRVEEDNFFAEGRAKRLTIVVDQLFGYHVEKLPTDSAEGSMLLPDEEILEPFRAILNMKSTSLVEEYRKALKEVHAYLLKLAMLPVEWSEENRRKALRIYLEEAHHTAHVQTELANYQYFCRMPDGQSVKSQFCYLRQRLLKLTEHGELTPLHLAMSDRQERLKKLTLLFGKDETNPSEDQIPSNAQPMADDELFAKLLYFVSLDGENRFPVLDEARVSNYLIRKDVFLTVEQERNLQSLFALTEAMRAYFDPVLSIRASRSPLGEKMQRRIDTVMAEVRKYNAKLVTLLAYGRTREELDAFFGRLFSPELTETYGEAQAELLELFEKDREGIKLKPYVHLLREAQNLQILGKRTAMGKEIYRCLQGEAIVQDANEETVNSYFSKTGYKTDSNWKHAIRLVEAVAGEYRNA